MSTLLLIIIFSLLSSLPSLIAGFIFKDVSSLTFQKYGRLLIAFATGTLLGVFFLDILPELFSQNSEQINLYSQITLLGFLLFFAFERSFTWHHHHHNIKCKDCLLPRGKIVILADSLHNFVDGIVIAIAFLVEIKIGILVSLSVIFHEIPQEISDFSILRTSGLNWTKAMLYNFLSALFSLFGAIGGYFVIKNIEFLPNNILAIAGGGFLFIAASDLIPEIKKDLPSSGIITPFIFILIGLIIMYLLGLAIEH